MLTIFGVVHLVWQVLVQQIEGADFSVPIAHTTSSCATPDCRLAGMKGFGTLMVAPSTPTGTVALMLIDPPSEERFHAVSIAPRAEAYRPVAVLGPK
jgi:hypothetical protein